MKTLLTAALAAMLASTALACAGEADASAGGAGVTWGSVDNTWHIVGYQDRQYCVAVAHWPQGQVYGYISVAASGATVFGISSDAWKRIFLRDGVYPVRLSFSSGKWGDFVAYGTSDGALRIDIGPSTFDQVKHADWLSITSNGYPVVTEMVLRSSRKAAEETVRCAAAMGGADVSPVGDLS